MVVSLLRRREEMEERCSEAYQIWDPYLVILDEKKQEHLISEQYQLGNSAGINVAYFVFVRYKMLIVSLVFLSDLPGTDKDEV